MTKTRSKRRRRGGNNKTPKSKLPDSCNLLDNQLKHYTSNDIWKTCIGQNGKQNIIYYITPKNAIMKDISTIRAPKFVLHHNGTPAEFSIQIDEQYVSCFLYINSHWYVFVMINFAVIENFRYYKLTGVKSLYDKSGTLMLKHTETVSSDTVRFKNATQVTKTGNSYIYDLMNNFATQKLVASNVRQAPVDAAAFEILDYVVV